MSESTPRSEALQPRSGAAAPLSGSCSMEISARGQCFLLFESLPVVLKDGVPQSQGLVVAVAISYCIPY
ncbi:hypothetical protein GGTG_13261 [Gaeumannomyces tritici R3-111a-1]|uniref:Uncharacterized protein n=1 Tax=Gaeumannomyces tritici (strain R3-111a-1) TaxID=644352 RepID=J3PID3_GAET3|nr:hypothetical protein GGTG_13261 [Gaeumannomyces tritici R3-111a-1]EJT69152.1 hypothetical protein GGTG_13261 [Gaeumannomyces tritici R3-111a-1]